MSTSAPRPRASPEPPGAEPGPFGFGSLARPPAVAGGGQELPVDPEPGTNRRPRAVTSAGVTPLDPDRRELLARCCAGAAACGGAAALLAVGRVAVQGPLRAGAASPGPGPWVDLGPLQRLTPGRPFKLPVALPVRDAWAELPARTLGNVVVVSDGARARVFSAACPHNGCEVSPRPDAVECPCHDTRFALDGAVLHGPSPRGLDPLEAEVVEGRLRVRWARFLPGIAARKPV